MNEYATWRRLICRALVASALMLVGHQSFAGSVNYSYDALGRLATLVYSNGVATTTITYSYDATGNRTSVVTTSP